MRLPEGLRRGPPAAMTSRFGRKLMKRFFAIAAAAAAASLISATAFAQTINLKLAHGSPRGHPNNMQADELARDIERVTNGRVKITVFGDRQLGDDRDII